jgi:hypothetical protein
VPLLDSSGEVFLAMDEVYDSWPSFRTALYSPLLGRRQRGTTAGATSTR